MSDSFVQRSLQELQVPQPRQEHREGDEGGPEHGECRGGAWASSEQGGRGPGGHPDYWR